MAVCSLYSCIIYISYWAVAYPGILFWGGGGVQQIQLRTEDREQGSGGGSQGFWRQL